MRWVALICINGGSSLNTVTNHSAHSQVLHAGVKKQFIKLVYGLIITLLVNMDQ